MGAASQGGGKPMGQGGRCFIVYMKPQNTMEIIFPGGQLPPFAFPCRRPWPHLNILDSESGGNTSNKYFGFKNKQIQFTKRIYPYYLMFVLQK